jgi:hypothetical protein
MKKILWAGALIAACLALPGRASAHGLLPGHIDIGAKFYVNFGGPQGPQCGPWYLYWPLEAHFQPPAPAAFPYWPASPMSLPPNFQAPPPGPLPGNGNGLKPAYGNGH